MTAIRSYHFKRKKRRYLMQYHKLQQVFNFLAPELFF